MSAVTFAVWFGPIVAIFFGSKLTFQLLGLSAENDTLCAAALPLLATSRLIVVGLPTVASPESRPLGVVRIRSALPVTSMARGSDACVSPAAAWMVNG